MKSNPVIFKILVGALALTLVLGLAAVATGTDSSSDPLVTLSYLTGVFKPALLDEVEDMIEDQVEDMEDQIAKQASSLESAMDSQETTIVSNDFSKLTVESGGTISVAVGNEILWLSGSGTVSASCLSDTTTGSTLAASGAMTANHLYVATGTGTITATSSGTYLIK